MYLNGLRAEVNNIMPLHEVVPILEARYGITFKYNREWEEYEAFLNNHEKLSIDISTYNTDDERHGRPFYALDYMDKKEHYGHGGPCDNLEEIYQFIDRHIPPAKENPIIFFLMRG